MALAAIVLHIMVISRQTEGHDSGRDSPPRLPKWDAWSFVTYYNVLLTLLQTWGFQLDFVAEGNVGALDIYRLFMAINLDSHSIEELQPVTFSTRLCLCSEQIVLPRAEEWRRIPLGRAAPGVPHGLYAQSAMSSRCWCVPLPWQLGGWINLLYSWRLLPSLLIRCCCAGRFICLFRRFMVRHGCFCRHFRCVCPYSWESTHQNCVEMCGCKFLLLRIITY